MPVKDYQGTKKLTLTNPLMEVLIRSDWEDIRKKQEEHYAKTNFEMTAYRRGKNKNKPLTRFIDKASKRSRGPIRTPTLI